MLVMVASHPQLSSTHTVQLEWFRISSAKMAQPSRVSNYLMAFSEVSSTLLQHVVNMTDGNGNTALHYSVSHSNFGVVGLLLDTGQCVGSSCVRFSAFTVNDGVHPKRGH